MRTLYIYENFIYIYIYIGIYIYQKGLTEKQEKLQKPLMSLIELISWKNKSAS